MEEEGDAALPDQLREEEVEEGGTEEVEEGALCGTSVRPLAPLRGQPWASSAISEGSMRLRSPDRVRPRTCVKDAGNKTATPTLWRKTHGMRVSVMQYMEAGGYGGKPVVNRTIPDGGKWGGTSCFYYPPIHTHTRDAVAYPSLYFDSSCPSCSCSALPAPAPPDCR